MDKAHQGLMRASTFFILPIRAYRYLISPVLGPRCRFFPSCAEYAEEAIEVHGPLKGTALAARRLCKCHPLHEGGIDLVPPKSPNL